MARVSAGGPYESPRSIFVYFGWYEIHCTVVGFGRSLLQRAYSKFPVMKHPFNLIGGYVFFSESKHFLCFLAQQNFFRDKLSQDYFLSTITIRQKVLSEYFLPMSETDMFFQSNLLTEKKIPQKTIASPSLQVKWMFPYQCIGIVNCGLFSIIPLDFWHFEI